MECQTRRDSFLIHDLRDIPDDQSEMNMVVYACAKLKQLLPERFPFGVGHISTAHLIHPRDRRNKSTILLVKFEHRWLRNDLFYHRHLIRDHRVSITEHLCEYRLWLLREARRKFGYSNVYTDQGQVYRNTRNNRSLKVSSIRDIHRE